MKLSEDLGWRGLIKDKTFADTTWLDEPRTFYLGIDASENSLTVGNLAVLMLARRLMDSGWQSVLLAGGATSLIGDPGGKAKERELKPREEVAANVEAIKAQVARLFAGKDFTPADNYDWFKDVKYLDFLREVGKEFSMSELIQREFVAERLGEGGSGISYAEFSYSLVQGYDYWRLYKNHKVELQIGGSDQWGNMLSGVALVRKKEYAEVHALSMPLVVNKETGQKFGKSESGAIWLDSNKTSPAQFYQFWINTSDEDAENYLKVFTLLGKEEIEEIIKAHEANPAERLAQKKLAETLTELVHGQGGLISAKDHAASLTDGSSESMAAIKLPSGVSVAEALVATGLAASNSEARRVVEENGVYVDNKSFDKDALSKQNYKDGRFVLRRGKKLSNSALVELE